MTKRNVGQASTRLAYILVLMLVFTSTGGVTQASEENASMESCIAEMLTAAPDDMTIGELRAACSEKLSGAELAADEG